jgi:hypothetical protein
MLSLSKLVQEPSQGPAVSEEKLAVMAFQQMYEMMLQGASDNSVTDMQTMLMSELTNQQVDNSNLSLDASLSILGGFNINSRLYSNNLTSNDTSENNLFNNLDIGLLSSKYESKGNPGVIANNYGDFGGKSYGAWQFSSLRGSLDSFINYLQNKNEGFYSQLADAKAADGGTFGHQFDNTWRTLAKNDKDGFLELQQSFVKETFYDTAAKELKERFNFDIDNKSTALKNVLWSTVVQHGVTGAVRIFSKVDLPAEEAAIISQVYDERQRVNVHFKSSSVGIRKSVYNRFEKERMDALEMLNNESI